MKPRSPTFSRSIAPLAVVALMACSTLFAQSGPIAHWTFDEGAGGTAADSSGNGHTGTLVNGTVWTLGLLGNAVQFDGVNDYLSVGMADVATPWTAALWVRREDSTHSNAKFTHSSTGSLRLEQYDGTDKVGLTKYGSFDQVFNYQAPVGTWVHLAFVCTSGGTTLYVNGVAQGSIAQSATLGLQTISHADGGMKGALDDFRVYDRALIASEIYTLASPDPAPPVARDDVYGIVGASQTIAAPGVLANDQDPNLDPFTAVKQSDPAHGTLSLNSDGSFTYTPTPGYEGADSFTYLARDADGDSNIATVTLHVGGEPLPAGPVKRLLHLGSTAGKVIVGYPTSGQSILWDFMLFAGYGPEYALQPRPGQSMGMAVATNENPMVWTILDDADGDWVNGVADRYVGYWALYFHVPSARDVRLSGSVDDEAWIWIDGNPAALECAGVFNHTVALQTGWHALLLKHFENTGNDRFSLSFKHTDGTDMTDLRYHMQDVVAPVVAEVLPAHEAASVPPWQDVMVTFREPMNTTIPADAVASLGGGSVAGSWAWTDNRTLTFTPGALWDPATTYTITLDPDHACDAAGNRLSGQTTFTFTTQARSSPGLASVSPASGWNASALQGVTLNGSGFLEGAVAHPPGARPFGGHYYRPHIPGTDWQSARSACVAAGGHLATLADASEDQFVWKLGGRMNGWIGFYDPTHTESNVWVTGEPVTYTNWAAGEPSNFGEQEPYGVYWWGFRWNDVGSSAASVRPYVCEFDRREQPQVRLKKAGQPDRVASAVKVTSGGALTFDVDLTGAETGLWDVHLTNSDGSTALLGGGFTVTGEPTPGDGLLAHWKFDEGSGGTAADASGNGHTGTLINSPGWDAGVLEGALRFNGSAKYVQVAPEGLRPAQALTVSLWARMEQSHAGEHCDLMRMAGLVGWLLRWSHQDGRVQLRIDRNSAVDVFVVDTQPNSAYLNKWTHFAATYDGAAGVGILYVNGVERKRVTGVPGLLEHSDNLYLGGQPSAGHASASGKLDDLRYFDRALSASEIAALIGPLPPQAEADKFSIAEDAPYSAAAPGVLTNDYDLNGQALSATLVTPPSHAQAFAFNADGSFNYTPVAGYRGLDTFTYKANDGAEDSAPATVTINVGGLVAHWKFDDGAGTTALDSSGFNHHGTLVNGPVWTAGVVDGALDFDGSTSHVTCGDILNDLKTPFTFATWIKKDTGSGNTVLVSTDDSPSTYAGFWVHVDSTGRTSMHLGSGAGTGSGARRSKHSPIGVAVEGQWTHLAFTVRNTTDMTIYVDGVDVGGTYDGTGGTMAHTTGVFQIAKRTNTSQVFPGLMDDVRVYDRALSMADVTELAAMGPPVAQPDSFLVTPDTPLSVPASGVLANDHDAGGAALSAVKDTDPAHGTLTLNADGSFLYTPAPGYTGSDGFTYHAVADGQASETVTVSFAVGNDVTAGLIGHWKLDEGTGTTAADSSANANHGTLVNGTMWGTGYNGGGVIFDMVNDYVKIPQHASLEPSGGVTVAFWARVADPRSGNVADLVRKSGFNLPGYLMRWSGSDGTLQWRVDRAGSGNVHVFDSQPNAAYSRDWHYFTGTFDASTGLSVLYVDGQERGRVQGAPGALEHSSDLHFGWIPFGSHVTPEGEMDDVRIYNRALSGAEVLALSQRAPMAVADGYGVAQGGSLTVSAAEGVLANDRDPNGQGLFALLEGAAPPGLSFQSNGSFDYTPPGGTTGLVTFAYRASDGNLTSTPVTVSIRLDAPLLNVTGLSSAVGFVEAELSRDVHAGSVSASSVTVTRAGPDQLFGTADDMPVSGTLQVLGGNRIRFVPNGGVFFDDRYRLVLKSTGPFASAVAQTSAGRDGVVLSSVSPTLATGPGPLSLTLLGQNIPIFNGSTTALPTVTFDGVDDQFGIPDADTLDVPAITLEAWVQPNTGGWVLSKRSNAPFQWNKFQLTSGSGARFHTVPDAGTPMFDLEHGSGFAYPFGTWQHLAASFQPNPDGNSGVKRLYVNGVLQGEEAFPYKLAGSNYQMNLGRFQGWDWAGYYKGKMAEVRYWKVARTQAQIRASMFGPVSDPDLIFRYDFNEAGPTAADRTGNGHTATSGGGVLFGGAVHVAPLMARLVKGSDEAVCSGAISSDGSMLTCEVDASSLPSGVYDVELLEGRSLLLARLARGVLVLSGDGVAASDGGVLDGEYDAALPSGNAAAGGDFVAEFTVDGQTPIVVSTVPANGATGVNQAVDVEIEFSEAMNRASVEAAIAFDPAVPYAAEWNGNTLVLRVNAPLAQLTEYTVTIGMGAEDLGGTALAAPYAFSFTTGQVTVTAINPSSSYPGLALSDVRIDGTAFFESSAEPGPPEAVVFGGHAYLYVTTAATWTTAKANCEALGGHLVTINSAEENAFVASLFSTGKVWIGATDAVLEGTFVWDNGEPVTYTNWYAGEPNNSGNEDYVEMLAGGLWNDRNNLSQGYICEFERAPPTVKLKLGATEIPASRIRIVSETELRAAFNLAGAASGTYDVVVTNPDGGGTGTLPGGFQVLQPPQLLAVTPPVADQNATVALTLTGSNLPTWTGTAQGPPSYSTYGVRITNGSNTVYATGALSISTTTLSCGINLTGLPLGLYDVTLLSGAAALATLPQGLRIIDPALTVTDLAGNALDGEYPGTLGDVQPDGLPSGNGAAGGDFVAYFDLQTSRMQVTALQPAPGAVLPAGPLEILATFAKPLHSGSVTAGSFELIRRGPDGAWNSSDDVRIVPAGIQFPAGHQAKLDLTGVPLINDAYRVRFKSSRPSGGMLYLDGNNDRVTIPDSVSLQCTEAVTVEAWFRFESGGSQNPRVVSEKSVFPEITTVGTGSSRRIDTTINLQGVGIVRVNGVKQLSAGQWHHAAVTYDRTALRLYLNGELEGQTAATSPIVVTGNPHVLGYQQGTSNDHYKGHLDEVRFWNRSRTQAEIQADMRRTLNGNEFGLVGYWTFDEGSGQTVSDRSGNGNHGTLGANSSAASDDPTRGASTTPLDAGVRDSHGNALDGEYPGAGGALPSGDGTAGGDFVAEFVVLSPYPALAAVNLTPGTPLSTGPAEILATFTKDLDPATVTAAHAHVLSAGPDGAFGSGDDIQFVPAEVTLENGNRIRLDLSNITWSSNFYRLRFIAGGLTDTSGNVLDGEYPGLGGAGHPLPTGNGSGGGNSILGFRINLPPTPAADGFVVDEDSTLYAASVLNNDSDLHGGDPGENNLPLSAVLVAGPVHAQAFTFNPDGTFTYTPVADYHGSDGFTYSAKDSLGMASAPTAVNLTVNSINDPPIALTDSYELNEDTPLTGSSVLTNDSDLHGGALGENNVPLSASLVVEPGHALAFTLNSDGSFQYTPQADFFGFDSFTYKAVDDLGGVSATTTVTLTVLPVEDIPTLTISAGLSSAVEADPGDLLDFIADATDADPDEVFVFHWDFGDGSTSSEQNPAHDYAEPGLYEVVATVTDSDGNQTQASMFVSVSGILKYTNLKVDQASYTLNHGKKATSGPMVDSWMLKGKINLQDLVVAGMNPANLTGQPLTARIADSETELGTPIRISSSSIQWQSPRGATPTFKATFSPVTGIFTLTLSQVDLATGLAAYGADNAGGSSGKLVLTPVELNLGSWTGTAVLGTRYTQTRVNASGKGAFKLGLSAHPLPSGLFFVDKLQVTQTNQGGVLKQRLSLSATFLAMPPAHFDPRANNTGAVVELGEFSETIGDGSLPGMFFTFSNGDTFTYTGPRNVLPGDPIEAGVISSFKLSRSKGMLTLMSNWTPVGPGDGIFGLPPVLDARGDPRTHATFAVAIDMEGVGGRQTVRLIRSGTSWKR